MPRTSILSLVVLPVVLALVVFAWTPGLAVRLEVPPREAAPALAPAAEVHPEDGASAAALVDAFYASHADGDVGAARLLGLFHPSATRAAERALWALRAGPLPRRELEREVRRSGDLVHVWSSYALPPPASEGRDPAAAAGASSFQLLHEDGRWWLVSVLDGAASRPGGGSERTRGGAEPGG